MYFDLDTGWAVGDHGAIITTRNGGTNWVIQSSGVTVTLRGINFFDCRTGYAVGDSGTILGTTDGGLHWTLQASGTTANVNGVVAYENNRAIAVGDSGLVLLTVTGGSILPMPDFFTSDIRFGRVSVGSQKISTMAVRNNGVTDLHVGSVSATPGEFAVSPGAGVVAPGETGLFEVTFSPALVQEYSGSITFYHDGAESSTVVRVSGSGMWQMDPTGWTQQNPIIRSFGPNDLRFVSQSKALMCGNSGRIGEATDMGGVWSILPNVGNTQNTLSSLTFFDTQTGYAVGAYGSIVKTTDGGSTWQSQESRSVDSLIGVASPTASRGVAVGYNPFNFRDGQIIRTTNGGETWTLALGTADTIPACVAFSDSNNGFVAASWPFTWPPIYGDLSNLYRTTDGGVTWTEQIRGISEINSMDFNGGDIGIAAGLHGYSLRTTDKGESWNLMPGIAGIGMDGVEFLDSTRVVMTAMGGVYMSEDAGVNWNFMAIDPGVFFTNAGFFGDELNGIALGFECCQGLYEKRIFFTSDGGAHWIDRSSTDKNRNLHAVSSPVPGHYTAVGDSCLILRSTDDGASWVNQLKGSLGERAGISLYGTACHSDSITYAVGSSGTLLRTSDGGLSWSDRSLPISTTLTGIVCVDETTCVAVGFGGLVARTTNSGSSWSTIAPGPVDNLYAIAANGSSRILVAGGHGAIMISDDAGLHWSLIDPGIREDLMGAAFADNSTAIVVSWDGKIFRTSDAGGSWVEVSYASTVYDQFKSISFANANSGTIVGAYGLILRSTDGGMTWNRQPSGTTSDLNAVVMRDDLVATAVGAVGTILHTTNGGAPGSILEVASKGDQPKRYELLQNYPNPFNPRTVIRYVLAAREHVTLKVYDVLGREVATLLNEDKPSGTYTATWDGRDVSSGVYFYRLTAGTFVEVKKMLLVR